MDEQKLMELLEIYMDLASKQDDVIRQLSAVTKKQAETIREMQAVQGFFEEGVTEGEEEAEQAVKEYSSMISEGI